MFRRTCLFLATALLLVPALQARAAEATSGTGMRELDDTELNAMRGRFTIDDHTVAWFGVRMISTWQTSAGQLLQGTLAFGMDFHSGKGQPTLTFTPSVSITSADAPIPMPASGGIRRVDGSGLANVGGLLQSVQVAGDGNLANNVARLSIRNGDAPPAHGADASTGGASLSNGAADVSVGFDGQSAGVRLSIAGQGVVQQWIRNGSLGQSVQLAADDQSVSNRLEIDLVRQAASANAPLAQNVAQAIGLTRGMAGN
ncbi:hypothetical protein [Frateuria terrea]|uniref:Uncharacterized protein n=1 Tax=Frateuria terrea TaxID=529704 RepID=A0A1H6WJA7_9GAMM|nr:hypothetical protein [Frateuria terrea]SEJ15796.1 hypothetical protein SAMN04487997_2576 [Frateuria terrea]SFP55509.1 hypothetical protein SAMN02927913_2553 [Frateuria terrea]